MNTILLSVSMLAALAACIIKKYLLVSLGGNAKMYYIYNAVTSIVSAVVLLFFATGLKTSLFTLLLGILFGVVTAIQFFTLMKAMDSGPFSYTAVINSLSTLIPTLSGYFIWHENISNIKIIGIVLMVVCLVFSVDFNQKQKKASLKWLFYCAVTFFSTGFIGVMQKWHQSSPYKSELDSFLIIAFLVSILCSLAALLITKPTHVESESTEKTGKALKIALVLGLMAISGVCVAINNKFNLYLSGVMDSAVFFPIVNGGGLILTSIAAFIIFKEKLSRNQWFGLIIGIISVIMLCDPFASL